MRTEFRDASRTLSIARLVAYVKMYWYLLSVERNHILPGGPSLECSPLCQSSFVNSVIFKHKEKLLRHTNIVCLFYETTKCTEEGGLV